MHNNPSFKDPYVLKPDAELHPVDPIKKDES